MELFELYGGPTDDPEKNPGPAGYDQTPVQPISPPEPQSVAIEGWPFDAAARRAASGETDVHYLDLGDGLRLPMRQDSRRAIRDGRCKGSARRVAPDRRGDRAGLLDEHRARSATSNSPASHHPTTAVTTGNGTPIATTTREWPCNEPSQPALKVSWNEAMEFCHWLSNRTGLDISLPTEAQWEYACRAGTDAAMHYGGLDADFGHFANMADQTFATFGFTGKSLTGKFEIEGGIDYLVAEGVDHADRRFDDGACVTAPVGGRRPNAFGLTDMHGNVAEWTLSAYRPYPYNATDGRNDRQHARVKEWFAAAPTSNAPPVAVRLHAMAILPGKRSTTSASASSSTRRLWHRTGRKSNQTTPWHRQASAIASRARRVAQAIAVRR